MNLNKPGKIILGIVTFLPLLLAISIIGFVIFHFFSMFFSQEPAMPMMYFSYLSYLLPYIFPAILLSLGLFIFYVVHIIQNASLDAEKRILWIVITFMAYALATPIYWYVHVWKHEPHDDFETDPLVDTKHESRTYS